jgi:hypothetical protein
MKFFVTRAMEVGSGKWEVRGERKRVMRDYFLKKIILIGYFVK